MNADHATLAAPSAWVARFAPLLPAGARVLDLACGGGRHARLFAARGCEVTAVDRDAEAIAQLQGVAGVSAEVVDLEQAAWPLAGRSFDAVVVTNYLYRPHFDALLACVALGGVLIYETFMRGNERFGKPSNPAFLLEADELLQGVAGKFTVLAFEQGEVALPKPAMVQRICALRSASALPLIPSLR
ncbi:MAG: class I SAM-dependent methyltransferase [Pseudazoarcus pumilus]|nr:class I SAM-dependent methyltransferase [Pseudazoarcus pumilus]